jgi:inorganic pyrophosphatase
MKIATFSNVRTTIKARKNLNEAFNIAIKGGYVMGFFLVSLVIAMLWMIINVLSKFYFVKLKNFDPEITNKKLQSLFKAISGFGVGASSVALFARVGGGIYTKAADVGADLVGKIESNLPEDDPRNPAVIADNVGDNVGDIAGMGADLYGSLAGSICACMILTSEIKNLYKNSREMITMPILLPLSIYSTGLLSSIFAYIIGIWLMPVNRKNEIKKALTFQEVIATGASSILLLVIISTSFNEYKNENCIFRGFEITWWKSYICCITGLIGGLFIGFVTEYYTSYNYKPVQEVSESCKTGTATNIIYGLSLGYKSTVVPAIILSIISIIANNFAGMYGISLATLGVLTTISTSLAIDAYGPICDNAGGIAEMSRLNKEVRERTDALDAAGNTTAAIGNIKQTII